MRRKKFADGLVEKRNKPYERMGKVSGPKPESKGRPAGGVKWNWQTPAWMKKLTGKKKG